METDSAETKHHKEGQRRYVVAYDIPDDRRRNQVARFLNGYGERVQYSVWECMLTASQAEKMRQGLARRLKAEEDRVRIYRLCPVCAGEVQTLGQAAPPVEVPEVYIV